MRTLGESFESTKGIFPPDAFSRLDESDDTIFYQKDRFVTHLDRTALTTVEDIIGQLIIEESPIILDLMASWDSHIPKTVNPSRVVGLGLNVNELCRNDRLSEIVIHDLNRDPVLPFGDETFDVVLNTVSVDYLTRPVEVFREVGRILKPGGMFLVIFSNRMFPEKATRIWVDASEEERIQLVSSFFEAAGLFEEPKLFVSRGLPRPPDDKYAHLGIPSDPVYALFADKKGLPAGSRIPRPDLSFCKEKETEAHSFAEACRKIKETLACPHCGHKMNKWVPPNSPFSTWDCEYLYICFNDECPYVVRGWGVMGDQGNRGMSYRMVYDPKRDGCFTIPIVSLHALREGIVDD